MTADPVLRQQLVNRIWKAQESWEAQGHAESAPANFIAAMLEPLVDARIAAAQAATSDRLIFNLGSLDGKDFMEAPVHYRAEEAHAWAAGHDAGVDAAAALARSVPGTTEAADD